MAKGIPRYSLGIPRCIKVRWKCQQHFLQSDSIEIDDLFDGNTFGFTCFLLVLIDRKSVV